MPEETTKTQLEKQLSERKDSIERRIDEIEDEIAGTPAAIRDAFRRHPLVGVAGAVVAGITVGFLVTRKGWRTKMPAVHQRLVEQYIDAVVEEVRRKVKRGKAPVEAVRDALRDRAPVIIYAPDTAEREDEEHRGFIRESVDIALKSALGFAVKTAVDMLAARIDVEKLQQMVRLEREERRTERLEEVARETQAEIREAAAEAARSGTASPSS